MAWLLPPYKTSILGLKASSYYFPTHFTHTNKPDLIKNKRVYRPSTLDHSSRFTPSDQQWHQSTIAQSVYVFQVPSKYASLKFPSEFVYPTITVLPDLVAYNKLESGATGNPISIPLFQPLLLAPTSPRVFRSVMKYTRIF